MRISIYFYGLATFCVLQEQFLRLGQIGFSCWKLIFAIFKTYPAPSIDNDFVLIEYVQ